MLKSMRKHKCLKDCDMCARTWPAGYLLIRVRATDKFDMRARAACVTSQGMNVEHVLVVLCIRKGARDGEHRFSLKDYRVFMFLC